MHPTQPHDIAAWGAHPSRGGAHDVVVWAPDATSLDLVQGDAPTPMSSTTHGVWRGTLRAGADRYAIERDGVRYADPAARAQNGGVHDASRLCTPLPPPSPWPGHAFEELVILEVHVGTFTARGTLAAAAARLPELAQLGVTAVELMPLAQFSGRFGWGYDGVLPFAVHPAYGTREDLFAFVEAAHRAGLSVILDVVYNHFGPVGAPLPGLCPAFFDARRDTPWGPAIDYTQRPVREFFFQNAEMWIADFGIDGLRIDAAHQIVDPSTPHVLEELASRARAAAPDRPVHLILEDERNLPGLRENGGYDAQWNDDYHHAVHCLLTGESEGYYASFAVDPLGDLCRALAEGHVEQGQPRDGLDAPRGAPCAHLPPTAFVNANQTHDQIGNRAMGERVIALAGPRTMQVAHALLLTSPAVPMLFMGEEIGARTPFQFFADYSGEMGDAVRDGRRGEFADFTTFAAADVPDPTDPATRDRSRPYDAPPEDHAAWRDLTARALAHRVAQVIPLLKSGRSGPACVVPVGEAALSARWPFFGGTIETVARFRGSSDILGEWPESALRLGDRANGPFFATRITA